MRGDVVFAGVLGNPGRHLGAVPEPAIGRLLGQGRAEFLLLVCGEQRTRGRGRLLPPAIAQGIRAVVGVATHYGTGVVIEELVSNRDTAVSLPPSSGRGGISFLGVDAGQEQPPDKCAATSKASRPHRRDKRLPGIVISLLAGRTKPRWDDLEQGLPVVYICHLSDAAVSPCSVGCDSAADSFGQEKILTRQPILAKVGVRVGQEGKVPGKDIGNSLDLCRPDQGAPAVLAMPLQVPQNQEGQRRRAPDLGQFHRVRLSACSHTSLTQRLQRIMNPARIQKVAPLIQHHVSHPFSCPSSKCSISPNIGHLFYKGKGNASLRCTAPNATTGGKENAVDDVGYDHALICRNGHVVNAAMIARPENTAPFCERCGSPALPACPSCHAPIRGALLLGGRPHLSTYDAPAYCLACGTPFPWTEQRLEAALILADEMDRLSPKERLLLQQSIEAIVRDRPDSTLAVLRFEKLMAKAGKAAAESLQQIMVQIVTEAMKKAIWG